MLSKENIGKWHNLLDCNELSIITKLRQRRDICVKHIVQYVVLVMISS